MKGNFYINAREISTSCEETLFEHIYVVSVKNKILVTGGKNEE